MEAQLKVDLSGLTKGMNEVQRKQLPFAMAMTLTEVAGHVGLGWQDEMKAGLDRPTPFTLNAVAVMPARKTRLISTVLIKDIAAEYLAPFVDGGVHALGRKRAILAPKNVGLNQYGNLPRTKVATLKGKPGVYVGPLKLRSGAVVSGVWQRPTAKRNGPTHLKLLVRFADPLPVEQHLPLKERALTDVARAFGPAFAKNFNHAMATAR